MTNSVLRNAARLLSLAMLCTVTALTAMPAQAKNQITIRNCSQVMYLSVKSYNSWDEKRSLTYQFGSGYVYPLNYNDTGAVECAEKRYAWSSRTDRCWIKVEKSGIVDTLELLSEGSYRFVSNGQLESRSTC